MAENIPSCIYISLMTVDGQMLMAWGFLAMMYDAKVFNMHFFIHLGITYE